MGTNRTLVKRWFFIYAAELAGTVAFFYVTAIWMDTLLFKWKKVWLKTDPGYEVLHFMDDNLFVILLILMVIFSIFWAWLNLYRISRGMDRIVQAIDDLYNDREISLSKEYHDIELQMNAIRRNARNNMKAAQEANQRKSDMLMYMAHDLKTPLTSVIGYLTLVSEEKEIPQKTKEKYVDIALKKSLRLEELINEFFDITRFNFSHMVLEKSTINLTMMLQQIVTEFLPEFANKHLETELYLQPNVSLFCDVNKMERVFDNLLKNMMNYSYPNTKMKVSMWGEADRVCIMTENSGRTIPPEMTSHIFDQFFRLDSSRGTSTGGAGLGLAVTKEIVTLHGGTILCESADETIRFRIVLPVD